MQFCTVCPTGAVVPLGQLSHWGSCRTGAVVQLGQLSYWGSCLTRAVWGSCRLGSCLPGQLSAWAVVAWAVVCLGSCHLGSCPSTENLSGDDCYNDEAAGRPGQLLIFKFDYFSLQLFLDQNLTSQLFIQLFLGQNLTSQLFQRTIV